MSSNPCLSSPCHNGGYCTNGDEGFVCVCPEPYTGPACDEVDVTLLHTTDVTPNNAEDIAHILSQATEDSVNLKSSEIPVLADVMRKLFAVGDLSETAIDHAFEAISSIVGSPQETLNEAHDKTNSSAVLSHLLETFGEHVLRPSMMTFGVSE